MIALDPESRDEEYNMFPVDILEILVGIILKYIRTKTWKINITVSQKV